MRLGFIVADAARYNTVSLTPLGRRALAERTPIAIREAPVAPVKARKAKSPVAADEEYDTDLFTVLKALRRQLADERDVPAYVIFSDAVLRAMARDAPQTAAGLRAISGVGDKKLTDFGDRFLAAIREVRG
jgi:ATP-dependent DNA helicase RecQ